jgi:hypothetical protein
VIYKSLIFYILANNEDIALKFETDNYGAMANTGQNHDLQRLKVNTKYISL